MQLNGAVVVGQVQLLCRPVPATCGNLVDVTVETAQGQVIDRCSQIGGVPKGQKNEIVTAMATMDQNNQ